VLFRPSNSVEADRSVAMLEAWERRGMRADGEILLSDEFGAEVGVAWREWASSARLPVQRVLGKTLQSVRLFDIDRLRPAPLASEPAAA
jgi:hypothetical protein